MPITSPVERISGPSTVRRRGSGRRGTPPPSPRHGRAAARLRPKAASFLPAITCGGDAWRSAGRSPWRRRAPCARPAGSPRARRSSSSLMANCTFIRPTTLSARASSSRLPLESATISGFSECGGSEQARVAGMDAGLLDMLHDPADEDVLAVGDGVDVDLDGVAQIACRAAPGSCPTPTTASRDSSGASCASSCTISMARPPST